MIKTWGDGTTDVLTITNTSGGFRVESDPNDTGQTRSQTITVRTTGPEALTATVRVSQPASAYGMLLMNLAATWQGIKAYSINPTGMSAEGAADAKLVSTENRTAKVPGGVLENWANMPSGRREMIVYADGINIGSFMLSTSQVNSIKAGTAVTVTAESPI